MFARAESSKPATYVAVTNRVQTGVVQRCGDHPCPPTGCHRGNEADEEPTPRRFATSGLVSTQVPPIVGEVLRSPGEPLDVDTAQRMGASFGFEFSGVRIHNDERAAESARAVGASAYTVGSDIIFAAGQYSPTSTTGRRLLTHELAHVVQQGHSPSPCGNGSARRDNIVVSDPGDEAEHEASALAAAVAQSPEQGIMMASPEPTPEHLEHRTPAQLTVGQGTANQMLLRDEENVADDNGVAGSNEQVPVLIPVVPRRRGSLESAAGMGEAGPAECQAVVAEQPPWMPAVLRRSPIPLGMGTRRQPKLKAPVGPSGALCRGACGPDCPNTCNWVGSYIEAFAVGNCGYVVEFPNALQCGTHKGCRAHDACFDTAVARGETYLFGPLHNQCNQEALLRWGPANTVQWAQGGGPYDGWWYFVDAPIIRKAWRLKD